VDSHAALPRVDHGADRLHAVELAPFRAAAAAGVGAVMTAHVVFPALDPTCVPATMSALILSGLLRERWGYQGLIVSDSLAMRAIADHGGIGDAAVRAVTAGCDLLLALGPDEVQDEVLERLARAIEGGIISEERLAGTRARVADAARRWAVGAAPAAPVEEVVGTPAHHDLARRIAEAAVTLVRDRAGTIPAHGRVGVVDFTSGHDESRSSTFAQVLSRYHPEVREIRAGGRDAATDLDSDAVVAVLGTRGRPSEALTAAVREIHSRIGDRLVVLSAGDPFDLFAFPGVPAWMVCYGTDAPSLHAAARVLVGQITARGRLPVALPGLSAAGEGT
jgi:beta-N-acetylhexosaminidase